MQCLVLCPERFGLVLDKSIEFYEADFVKTCLRNCFLFIFASFGRHLTTAHLLGAAAFGDLFRIGAILSKPNFAACLDPSTAID
jgi:hypothetical protein